MGPPANVFNQITNNKQWNQQLQIGKAIYKFKYTPKTIIIMGNKPTIRHQGRNCFIKKKSGEPDTSKKRKINFQWTLTCYWNGLGILLS